MRALSSSPTPHPLTAYVAARYTVHAPTRTFQLVIGQRFPDTPAPDHVHALLTACNPASRVLEAGENEVRTSALRARLKTLGLAWWPALNAAPNGRWREPSCWIVDVPLCDVDALALEYGQNATVIVGPDSIVRLRVHRNDWSPAHAGHTPPDWLCWQGAPFT